jgi:hypothetical protein
MHSNRPISHVSAEPCISLWEQQTRPLTRMRHDHQDEPTPLWEVVVWCLFALISLSGLAYFVFVLLFR